MGVDQNAGIDRDQLPRPWYVDSSICAQLNDCAPGCKPLPATLARRNLNALVGCVLSAITFRRPASTNAFTVVLRLAATLRASSSSGSGRSKVVFIWFAILSRIAGNIVHLLCHMIFTFHLLAGQVARQPQSADGAQIHRWHSSAP